ncbi:uncharacterized protein [Haliotis cracherodii]|uniref:uncharacterized protein isoform X2 n=1 Tax=Haliotis cracherodii TaxID=6455 RepID=UPI0039EC4250
MSGRARHTLAQRGDVKRGRPCAHSTSVRRHVRPGGHGCRCQGKGLLPRVVVEWPIVVYHNSNSQVHLRFLWRRLRTRTKYRLSMAQTTYVEHMPMLYDQRGCDYTYDYSSDVSSPASSSASPQHSPLLSDDEAAHHWFLTNPVEVTYSGYHINEPAQEYTPLAPMDSSCLHYVDPRPEVEMHMPRAHPRGSDVLKIEKLENQVFAVFGRHRYSIDPEDKFDASNCYPSNVAKSVVTHTAAEESVSIFYPQPPRRTQGTRSKRLPRAERLWEFILRLLLDPSYNPSHIEWVDREKGMFRLVNSRGIARMWGKRKNNLDMTYEKLSRAMRYYYHRKILQPVFGKKLVYKFGPNSTGWQLN